MKLIGSVAEQSFREGLSASWAGLREPGNQLFSIMVGRLGLIDSAFVLNWTPEQSEDLYTVLVNGVEVIQLEVSRLGGKVVDFQIAGVKDYERSLRSQWARIRLAVALDLAGKR
ncbi:hypothetical protein [Stenotrophomonas maltophilia]|uniref:hypothetical protein n=1 Tax=Stenotrophomonas maltophilia TaxID=40324 RepID=UPI0011B693CC|nr:hypothetical protein [Stenotrophomonas maltophilia]